MKRPVIDIDEIQKAMEDVERNAFEYFLDRETGDVIILSEDILNRAEQVVEKHYEDDLAEYDAVELDEEPDIPEWMEDEIELALEITLFNREQYIRIPERDRQGGFDAMKEFAAQVGNEQLRSELEAVLEGKGAFRRFKDLLDPYPKERKLWYGFNAKATRREIESWLTSVGITLWKDARADETQ